MGGARRKLLPEVGSVTINGKYYSEIYGETFVGQNIWAPYMTQILAGTPVENVSSANIGATNSNRSSTPTPSPTSSGH